MAAIRRIAFWILFCGGVATAMDQVRIETRTDEAVFKHGVSGRGVIVAILDRGIDWSHPDFLNADGTTRIKWALDMTGQNLCNPGPGAVEYTEAQINAALRGKSSLSFRDAVGHGTVTTGIAAGNGSAFSDGKYRGIAPNADLIIVKVTSEGAPAHDGEPEEAFFQGCLDQALNWLDQKIIQMNQPCVALINSGVQWGPMDGTSAVSRKIDQVFGEHRPGRVYVAASGDEGGLNNHAGGDYSNSQDAVVALRKRHAGTTYMSLWYTGSRPARVTVAFQDGAEVGVNPGGSINQQGIYLIQYAPGNEFYPWRSTSGDRAVWMRITGHAGEGRVVIHGTTTATGHFDLYGSLDNVISFSDHLVLGRLTDYATTRSAIVAGAHVVRTAYVDLNGHSRILDDEGAAAELWLHSSAGPTRDGRLHGVDVSAPGHNCFAAYAAGSYWRTFEFNLIHDGGGWYGRAGATSGSAPIVVGAVALMLERKPMLTAAEIREVLRETARADDHTGSVPNADWGYGKLDILRALDAVCPDQDFDCDGDRDLEDAYVLMRCMNGPDNGEPPMLCPQAYFHRSDSDGDQDADLMDYADFQRRTGIPAP